MACLGSHAWAHTALSLAHCTLPIKPSRGVARKNERSLSQRTTRHREKTRVHKDTGPSTGLPIVQMPVREEVSLNCPRYGRSKVEGD